MLAQPSEERREPSTAANRYHTHAAEGLWLWLLVLGGGLLPGYFRSRILFNRLCVHLKPLRYLRIQEFRETWVIHHRLEVVIDASLQAITRVQRDGALKIL